MSPDRSTPALKRHGSYAPLPRLSQTIQSEFCRFADKVHFWAGTSAAASCLPEPTPPGDTDGLWARAHAAWIQKVVEEKKKKNARTGVCMCLLFSQACRTMPRGWIHQDRTDSSVFFFLFLSPLLTTASPVDYSRAHTAKKKEGSVVSAFVLPAFDSVEECISLRALCKPCMPLTYFHSRCNETLMCKSNFPCAPLQSEGKKNDSAGPSNPRFPTQHFTSTQHNDPRRVIPLQFSPAVHLTKLRLLVLGRKGHGGKSLWRSIRQFSVGSAADAQVIYSEGARTAWWRMLADTLPCLPNFFFSFPSTVWSMRNNLARTQIPWFYSASRLVVFTGKLKYQTDFMFAVLNKDEYFLNILSFSPFGQKGGIFAWNLGLFLREWMLITWLMTVRLLLIFCLNN